MLGLWQSIGLCYNQKTQLYGLNKTRNAKLDLKHVLLMKKKLIVIEQNNKIVCGITINMNKDNLIRLQLMIVLLIFTNMRIAQSNQMEDVKRNLLHVKRYWKNFFTNLIRIKNGAFGFKASVYSQLLKLQKVEITILQKPKLKVLRSMLTLHFQFRFFWLGRLFMEKLFERKSIAQLILATLSTC